jgi:Uma2 family endonuclease
MTYEEWQDWLGADETHRGEWVKGEVVDVAMPKYVHQAILLWVARLLSEYADRMDLGQVGFDGTEMWLPARQTARLPDLFFVATANLDRLSADRLTGPADLVVEIVSKDSVTRDYRDKFHEYQSAGIPEYWVIESRARRHDATFYALDVDGIYRPLPRDTNGRVYSRVLSKFWLDPAWLWQEPRVKPYELIARILAERSEPFR